MVGVCDYDQHRSAVAALCDGALNGTVSLDQLNHDWPCRAADGSYWEKLRDDLEDAITHTPGTWCAGKVDTESWRKSYEYVVVYFHRELLRSNVDPSRFLELRAKALTGKYVSVSVVDSVIREAQRHGG
jgi:hypothetical protein